MTITIYARGFALTDGIHDHVHLRIQSALGGYSP